MRALISLAFAGALALSAGAAFAQSDNANAAPASPAATVDSNAAPLASSSTLGDSATMKAGDPNVVSNGPVPDTAANRKAYGAPLSHAGRATSATGD